MMRLKPRDLTIMVMLIVFGLVGAIVYGSILDIRHEQETHEWVRVTGVPLKADIVRDIFDESYVFIVHTTYQYEVDGIKYASKLESGRFNSYADADFYISKKLPATFLYNPEQPQETIRERYVCFPQFLSLSGVIILVAFGWFFLRGFEDLIRSETTSQQKGVYD